MPTLSTTNNYLSMFRNNLRVPRSAVVLRAHADDHASEFHPELPFDQNKVKATSSQAKYGQSLLSDEDLMQPNAAFEVKHRPDLEHRVKEL